VQVLNHDANGVVALIKPAGVLSHPNAPGEEPRSLLQAGYDLETEAYGWTGADGIPARLHLLNRLDSATSGVILACADAALAREIRAQFKRKRVRKVYQALVFGHPGQPRQLWRDRLAVVKRGEKIRTTAGGNVPAECEMTVVRAGRKESGLTLIRLEPRTGRSHQLRVQCARQGLPIVGDQTYGDFSRNREFARLAATKRMFLHSQGTDFEYEHGGKKYTFAAQAPLPVEFQQFL
jgi:23S rRNA-/tRNA-specific pseudouridylate synthase